MSIFGRWFRRGGKEPDPTIGLQIGLAAGAVAATEATKDNDSTPDYGWSGDHMSGGGSDYGGGGGFDGGGGGGDSGGGGY
jgi:hypothetical protein